MDTIETLHRVGCHLTWRYSSIYNLYFVLCPFPIAVVLSRFYSFLSELSLITTFSLTTFVLPKQLIKHISFLGWKLERHPEPIL